MRHARRSQRKGSVIVLVALLLTVVVGLGAFAIDVGYIEYSRSQLQAGADAAALACADDLPSDQATLDQIAAKYASLNVPWTSDLQVTVEGGTWNSATATFTVTDLSAASAVRVSAMRSNTGLYFASMLGVSEVDISASAVATKPSYIGSRFLIDDEMIDKDVAAIEDLANSLGRDVEELVTARGFNQGKQYGGSNWTWTDNFLDLPAGAVLTLPTGQGTDYDNNDAGMFDIDHPQFPFADAESFMDFIMWSETGNDPTKWGTHDSTIGSQLDPLPGVAPVTDASSYPSFVDPNFIHVSPVTMSDVSTLNMQGGVPRVNAKGLRRGLIAFKIIAVGNDIDGGGSVLPQLVIEIQDPATINPEDIRPAGQVGGQLRLVQ